MIGYVRGIITITRDQFVFVDVSGVGYKVFVSPSTLPKLPKDTEVTLYTYMHVKEDVLELFGFLNLSDITLFEQLIGISGIGPKTALGIFSLGESKDIIQAIINADTSYFSGVPRLGKKNAQKIIIELKNKVGSTRTIDLSESEDSDEVITALQSIGFSQKEAYDAFRKVNGEGKSVEEKIKLALKYLGK